MTSEPLITLDGRTTRPATVIGGKAWAVQRLLRAGVPTPPGVVLGASVFASVLHKVRAAEEDGTSDLERFRARLRTVRLPPEILRQLRTWAKKTGRRFAVRSSGVEEDGATHSYAGLFDTRLGVGVEELEGAITEVWASAFSDAAVAYRQELGLASETPAMAVLIQPMIEARASGVLFTIDPAEGAWREMVVEAVHGLAEPLVSGQVSPHSFRLGRPRRLGGRLSRRLGFRRVTFRRHEPASQEYCLRLGPEGLKEHRLNSSDQAAPLRRAELLNLGRVGLEIEAHNGGPQDIEWAIDEQGKLWILQARPITAAREAIRGEEVLWTRRFMGERWTQPATPMGWSLVEPVLSWFISYPRTQASLLGGGASFRLVDSYPYVNATIFRHLAFKLPGAAPPEFMLEFLPEGELAGWRSRYGVWPDFRVYGSVLWETILEKRWERFAWNPATNHGEWRVFSNKLFDELQRERLPPVTAQEAASRVRRLQELLREYVGIHVTSLLFANLAWQSLSSALNRAFPTEGGDLMEALAVCPPGNATLRANAALWALGQKMTEEDIGALEAGEALPAALDREIHRLVDAHGHRSTASWEVFSARWGDERALLAQLLRGQWACDDPSQVADERERRWAEAVRRVRTEAPVAWKGPILGLIYYTRRYLLLRENQRYEFDKLLSKLRNTLETLGEEGVRRGVMELPSDIRWARWPEVEEWLGGSLGDEVLGDRIRSRSAAGEAHRPVPPPFMLGERALIAAPEGKRVEGQGISPGRAKGKARVARSLAEAAALEPGEILVTHAVDPGWTPLLLRASAVVLELGGALSHGAVVAREYGVPMVVNVSGVVRRIRSGDVITVDGRRGLVWLHEDEAEP